MATQSNGAVNKRLPAFWPKPINDLVEKHRLVSLTFAVDISSHPIPITVRLTPKGQLQLNAEQSQAGRILRSVGIGIHPSSKAVQLPHFKILQISENGDVAEQLRI